MTPCPFCGGEAEPDWRDESLLHRCLDCDSKGPQTYYKDYKYDDGYTNEEAVEMANILAWNRRFSGTKNDCCPHGNLKSDLCQECIDGTISGS